MTESQSSGLFREQAVEHQKNRLAGDVIIAQPISFSVITAFLLLLIAIAIVFLWQGEYARKEVVQGYLLPTKGLLKAYAPRMGSISSLHVSEGQSVKAGDPLITLTTEQALSDGRDASQGRLLELQQQAEFIAKQQEQAKKQYQATLKGLNRGKARLAQELIELESQLQALAQRHSIYQDQLTDLDKLLASGYVTKRDYQNQKQQLLAVEQEEKQLRAYLAREQFDLAQIEQKLEALPSEYKQRWLELSNARSSIEQQLLTEETNYRLVLRATAPGTIAAIEVKQGETLSTAAPLLTIIPEGAKLQAELWLPTRAAGFIRLGQQARLRFDAFPYQRFGMGSGQLAQISGSITFPDEARLPVQLQEPVYKVLVDLNAQSLTAYGKKLPLQAGMLLEADIVLDSRNLLDWLLDPLYSLRGKV